ncbi:MAG: exosortase C-terminal domain/associated protein EpsI [Gemmatimonadota bacterium]
MRRSLARAALPAAVLLAGFAGRLTIQPERTVDLERPLAAFPARVAGFEASATQELSSGELRVLRPDDYLLRTYEAESGVDLTLFVAFYGRQASGSSVHSPRNCLPGSGWEPVRHDRVETPTVYGDGWINRYLVEHESGTRALVYYWYQGRGRIAANEYLVKFDLLRDAIVRRRTDEALVRLVFTVGENPEDLLRVDAQASRAVREVIRLLSDHVPA